MLQFLILFLIFEAAKSDVDLVKGVKNSLNECSDIVEAVGDFLSIFEAKVEPRRRKDDLGVAVAKKLKTCAGIIEAVDAFRTNHFSPMAMGYIALQFDEARFLAKMLRSVSKKMGEILYIASQDGDTAAKFHSKCDNQGPNVVIIESTTGAVFGGYTDRTWTGGAPIKSTTSFLYRLRPVMTKYALIGGKEKYAIWPDPKRGPTFGGGHDIEIKSSALSATSHTNGGHTYKMPSYPNYQLNDGSKYFKVKDYVVAQAIKL